MTSQILVFPGGDALDAARHPHCAAMVQLLAEVSGRSAGVVFAQRPEALALLGLLDMLIVGLEQLPEDDLAALWDSGPTRSLLPPGASTEAGAQALCAMLFPGRFDPLGSGLEAQNLLASLAEIAAAPMDSGEERLLFFLAMYCATRWRDVNCVRDPARPREIRAVVRLPEWESDMEPSPDALVDQDEIEEGEELDYGDEELDF
jgi:hypothetical protein